MTVGITELPPEGMQLPGVALAGDTDRGTKTTEGISLLFTTAGVTVQGPQPQIERLLVWSALDSATCREKIQLPDGREAAIMELTSGGQSIRFLLPSDAVSPGQAAYLDQALPTWLVRYKGLAAPAAPAPVAPGAESAATAQEAEVGVALPSPGPAPATTQPVTHADVAAEAPVPAFAAASAASLAAAGQPMEPPANNGQGAVAGGPSAAPPAMQAPPMQAPAAPLAPAAPAMQAPPPPPPAPAAPTMPAPTMQAPPPPPPSAPAAPVMPASPAAPVMPAAQPPTAAQVMQDLAFDAPAPPAPTGTAWDNPPLGVAAPDVSVPEPKKAKKPRFALTRKQLHAAEAAAAVAAVDPAAPASQVSAPTPGQGAPDVFAPEAKKAKKPRFALTRKQLHAAEAAAAGAAVGAAAAVDPAPVVPQSGVPAPPAAVAPPAAPGTAAAPEAKKAKKPRFALTRKQLHAAEAAATGTAVVGAAAAIAPPTAPPSDPVPLGVQLPPPVAAQELVAPPMGQPLPPPGVPGAGEVVLADAGSKSSRRNLVLLVALLVLVVAAGAGYVISKKSNSTPTAPPVTAPVGAADTALAAAVNLRLTDLPSRWTQAPPAQAVVRPPVAPAAAQATASNAMASCLSTSYAVVSGLFDSGSLPGQTSLVQSPMFASAAGSTMEMASRTTTLASPGQVQALDAVFTNPKFDLCYQQYHQTLAQAAVPGAVVQVQPVTLPAPTGVRSYGVVSTYTLPGSGTQVVGDAYVLGGRVVTVIQPSTDGAVIPSSVFAPAYDAVAGRVAASASK